MFTYTKVFPCNSKTKKAMTAHWKEDASGDPRVIERLQRLHPNCLWGFPTGNGVFVIDVDTKNGGEGLKNWQELTRSHGEPCTFTVQTRSGGYHYYFAMPSGTVIRNSQDNGQVREELLFAKGVDIRGEGGYVIAANGKDYVVVNEAEVTYPPDWIVERLTEMKKIKNLPSRTGFVLPEVIKAGQRNGTLFAYGCKLQAQGKSDEEIHSLMIKAWEKMEQPKDDPFTEEQVETTYQSVIKYPKGHSDEFKAKLHGVNRASQHATPEEYLKAMLEMGYSFSLNELTDTIYVNGKHMSDVDEAEMLYHLGNTGYTSREKALYAYSKEANAHRFHPIRDYLSGLEWDGQDHIGKLASFVEDVEGVFELYLTKWLVGSVAKVLHTPMGSQNRTFVLVGDQNAGKSFFCRWLAGGVPHYHVEKSINPEDKDDYIRKISSWIWEVSELGATTRKADLEALKNFQSTEQVTVRKPFARHDLHKPALANFIGTVNNEGAGFLNDTTGSRRYMSCTIKAIDWRYSKEVDVNQLWAQAVAMFYDGHEWNLRGEEAAQASEINATYEVESTMNQLIARYFDIDKTQFDLVMPTNEIIEHLRKQEVISITDRAVSMEISRVLNKIGLRKQKMTPVGYSHQVWCWIGISPKDAYARPLNMVQPIKKMPANGASEGDDL